MWVWNYFIFRDYWFRYEFAAGRGMIHSHGVIFSLLPAKKIKEALEIFLGVSQGSISSNVATELEKVLQNADYNSKTFFCPEYVSMLPACGETVILNVMKINLNGHIQRELLDHLVITHFQQMVMCLHLKHGIQKLHIDMCNKVILHKCNSYCLRKNPVTTKDADKVEWACRFGYGNFNNETKKSSVKGNTPFTSSCYKR